MSYEDDGYLTTDEQSPGGGDDSLTWTTETDWNNAQASEDVEIVGGSFRLASAITIVDDFEDGDIDEYTKDTSYFSTQTGTVIEGTYALQGDTDGIGREIRSSPGDGLNYYPGAGDTIRYNVRLTNTDDVPGFFWCNDDADEPSEGYRVLVDESNNDLILQKASWSTLSSTSVSIPLNEWLEVEIDHSTDGTIAVTLFDSDGNELASTSATDTDYTSGTINFQVNSCNGCPGSSTSHYWDYVRVV